MNISLIAAIDENNGIGKNNQLLCYLPADLQHFKKLTLGKSVIMGRKTFDSIGKPLVGRQNIVLSTQKKFSEEVDVVHSFTKAFSIAQYNEIMVIGGESVFREALPLAQTIYLTLIHHEFNADVFFPAIDFSEWKCIEQVFREKDEKNKYDLTFFHYHRLYNILQTSAETRGAHIVST